MAKKLSSAAEAKLYDAAAFGDRQAADQLAGDLGGAVYLAALDETKDPRTAAEARKEFVRDLSGVAARRSRSISALAYTLREGRRLAREIATKGTYHVDAPQADALLDALSAGRGEDGPLDETTSNLLILTKYLGLTPKKAAKVIDLPGSAASFRLRAADAALGTYDLSTLMTDAAGGAPGGGTEKSKKRYAPNMEFSRWFPVALAVTVCVLAVAASVTLGILGIR